MARKIGDVELPGFSREDRARIIDAMNSLLNILREFWLQLFTRSENKRPVRTRTRRMFDYAARL
jgi:hypothetical protein